MLARPMDVLSQFPVRKSKKQKAAFRAAVQSYLEGLDYTVTEERGSYGSRNLIIGDPEQAKYLVTAHYDTCARLPFPNFITPCNFLPYLGYQLFVTAFMFAAVFLITLAGTVLVQLACTALGSPLADDALYVLAWALSYAALLLVLLMMFIGPANLSNANDNTSGVVTVLEIARTLPENQRHKVCFVLFDLEEAGLIGSASYYQKHKKAARNQLVLNLDCVGDGDHLMLFPTKKLKKDRKKLTSLYKACGYFGKKSLVVREKGFSFYPSDQTHFPYGVGICALNKKKKTLYLSRIHTKKDTVLDETNVNILRAAISSFITCDAAQ